MKIHWLIDPFENDLNLQKSALWVICDLLKRTPAAVVQPVYVACLPANYFNPTLYKEWQTQIQTEAQDRLKILTRGTSLNIKQILPLKALMTPSTSLREKTKTALTFAKKNKADLMILSTQAKKGIKRVFLGSFAETLTLYSHIPLLLINPYWKRFNSLDHFVFATDLSKASHRAYRKILKYVKLFKSKITLFHKLSYPVVPSYEFAFAIQALNATEEKRLLKTANQKLKKWCNEGKKLGIPVKSWIDVDHNILFKTSFSKLSDKTGGVMAMTSSSSLFESVFLGSFTRQMTRETSHPLWIMRP